MPCVIILCDGDVYVGVGVDVCVYADLIVFVASLVDTRLVIIHLFWPVLFGLLYSAPFRCSLVRSFVRSCVRSFARFFFRLFVRSFVASVHSCIRAHACMHVYVYRSEVAIAANRRAALSAALLTAPLETPLPWSSLLGGVVQLSYSGDVRTGIAENPSKALRATRGRAAP